MNGKRRVQKSGDHFAYLGFAILGGVIKTWSYSTTAVSSTQLWVPSDLINSACCTQYVVFRSTLLVGVVTDFSW